MPASKVPDEDAQAVIRGEATVAEVAKKNNVSYNNAYSKVKRARLSMSFKPDSGDADPAPVDQLGEPSADALGQIDDMSPQDVEDVFKGLFTFVDGLVRVICLMTPQLEYTPLTPKDYDILLAGSRSQKTIAKMISGTELLGLMLFFGNIVFVFMGKIKIKKKNEKPKVEQEQPKEQPKVEIIPPEIAKNLPADFDIEQVTKDMETAAIARE